MSKKEELLKQIDDIQQKPPMIVDDAVKLLGMYNSAGEFIQIMAEIQYRVMSGDIETAKEMIKYFLGHTMFVLDKVGQGDVEKFKNELLKIMAESANAQQKVINEAIAKENEKFITVPINSRKKKK